MNAMTSLFSTDLPRPRNRNTAAPAPARPVKRERDFGVGYGLTRASDRLVVKTIIGYAFPVPGTKESSERASANGAINPMAHLSARSTPY